LNIRVLPQHLTIAGALALALCLVASLAAGSGQAYAAGKGYRTGQVIVKLNPIIGATIEEINADYGTTTRDEYFSSKDIYLLNTPNNKDAEAFAEDLAKDAQNRVLYAEPNLVAETPEGDGRHRAWGISSTSESSDPYAAQNLGLSCAAQISQGQGTKVAVLDTGAQLNHPALKANFKNVQRYDFVDNDTDPSDQPVGLDEDGDGIEDRMVGHGTHVAGIVDQVAPAAKIMPLRVLDSEGYGDVFTISKAISFAQRNGAHVINLSLGTSRKSKLLKETIDNAIAKGIVVAAAAGNSNTNLPHYPAAGDGTVASVEGLLAVTSVDKIKRKSRFANYGSWVDIAAPGEDIRSAFPIGKYANWSGTSMSTPFISGQTALIRNVYGSITPTSIETKVRKSAQSLLVLDPVYGTMLGAGHADVCKSLG
jgi:subtilisin family serine protease